MSLHVHYSMTQYKVAWKMPAPLWVHM